MKRKESVLRDVLSAALPLCLGEGLLLYAKPVSAAVSESLGLCAGVLLPALFPFFVVSALLCGSDGVRRLAPRLNGLMGTLFGLPGTMAPALLLGAVGGYPVGAKTVCRLYGQGACTKEQALSALRFCCNAGPSFVIGAVGTGLLGDGRLGLRLWLAHLAAALLIGSVFRVKSTVVKADNITPYLPQKEPGSAVFLQAVTGAVGTFLNVCAFVLLFSVLLCLLERLPVFSALPPFPAGLLYGVLELTGGAARLAACELSPRVLMPALSFLCGWGGLSVQCQTVDLLQRAGLPCRGYLRAKLLHGLLAAALTLLISR